MRSEISVVTGAFSFTGRYIAQRLLSMGFEVRTITGHPERAYIFDGRVKVYPFSFNDPERLRKSLEGATTLYNTYWIRFPWRGMGFERAVKNTQILIRAAEEAGVRRIVHISITNANENSPLPYFRGKGIVEGMIKKSRLSYGIVRPTVIFGIGAILINNIAWLLRRFPIFAIFGDGKYHVQPVYVGDVADICVDLGQKGDNLIVEAAGPEAFTFEEMVCLMAKAIGSRARIVHVPPRLGLLLGKLAGYFVKDVVITWDEIKGLMSNLLLPQGKPVGHTPFTKWISENASQIGTEYISELKQHYR